MGVDVPDVLRGDAPAGKGQAQGPFLLGASRIRAGDVVGVGGDGRARQDVPAIWDWKVMAEADSMLNTPPTFSIYLLGLILHWIEDNGGLAAMGERNDAKAQRLYGAIDASDFYTNPVEKRSRSAMNIPFTLADPALDAAFLAGAEAAGLTNLKGHRSVGGMRASIYNAMPDDGVTALIDYMTEFERTKA